MQDRPMKTKSKDLKTRTNTEKAKPLESKIMLARSYQMNERHKSTKQPEDEKESASATNQAVFSAQGNSEQAAYKAATIAKAAAKNLYNGRRKKEQPQSTELDTPTPVEQGRQKAINEYRDKKTKDKSINESNEVTPTPSTSTASFNTATSEERLSAAGTKNRTVSDKAKSNKAQPEIKTKAVYAAQQKVKAQSIKNAQANAAKAASSTAKVTRTKSKLPLLKKFQIAATKIKTAKTVGKLLIGIGGGL